MQDFRLLAEQHGNQIVSFRRELHAHPELSGQEVRTSKRISEELEKLGIPCVIDEKRNVIGKLVGGKPGGRIAIRGDFDALSVTEQTGLPFASETPGVMHACGHDGHAAGLLGVASILSELRDTLCGTVYLCFQMGEEISEGAQEIVRYLDSEGGVDCVIASHLMPRYRDNEFFCSEGPFMSGCLHWSIIVHGKGGHGSTPWTAIDPIKPAAEILLRITALAGNSTNPFDVLIVSPCMLHAGSAPNIIPESAEMRGTMRFYRNEYMEEAPTLLRQIAEQVAASYGATAEVVIERGTPPVINDAGFVTKAKQLCSEMGMRMCSMPPATGSDNFGEFTRKYPGFYCFSCDTRAGQPMIINHNPKFDIDEQAMLNSTAFLSAFAYRFLANEL